MAETLVIRLPDDDSNTAAFVLVDASGSPAGDVVTGSLEEAAGLAEGRRVVTLAPAGRVLLTSADIPLRNRAKIRQALPFALEEQLATDVEAQHFAFGARNADGRLPVAVVATDVLAGWLERLNDAGIRADALYAESDGLAALPTTISVLVDGERVIIREPDGTATVADSASLQAVMELLIDENPGTEPEPDNDPDTESPQPADTEAPVAEPTAAASDALYERDSVPLHILVYCNETDYDRFAIIWDMLRLRVDSLDVRLLTDGPLPRIASQVVAAGGVNLLQGPYAPRRELPIDLRQWVLPGALLGALLALLVLKSAVETWQLVREDAALDAAAAQLLSNTFPDADGAPDPWAALRSRLGDIGEPGTGPVTGFADALAALATAMSATPGIRIEALGYRDGKMDLQLVAPSVEKLEQLRKGVIANPALSAEIQSANPDGDTIRGRMKIAVTNQSEAGQ